VQRLPRYELLLKNLSELTPTTHVDYQNLIAAYNEVKKVNEYINERKKKDEAKDMYVTNVSSFMNLKHSVFLLSSCCAKWAIG
jgi:hypothetical protein